MKKLLEKPSIKFTSIGQKKGLFYEDPESGEKYGLIAVGFAYPFVEKPGFVVAVGEHLERDHTLPFSPRHKRILEEFESPNLEELYRCCLRFKDELHAGIFLGSSDDPIYTLWRNFGDKSARISLTKPANFDQMNTNYVIQLVRKHTVTQKTLHFKKGGLLPGYLAQLRAADISGKELETWPPVAALGYALSNLENTEPLDLSGLYQGINAIRMSRGKQQNVRRPW